MSKQLATFLPVASTLLLGWTDGVERVPVMSHSHLSCVVHGRLGLLRTFPWDRWLSTMVWTPPTSSLQACMTSGSRRAEENYTDDSVKIEPNARQFCLNVIALLNCVQAAELVESHIGTVLILWTWSLQAIGLSPLIHHQFDEVVRLLD